jgi:hypothetical protein
MLGNRWGLPRRPGLLQHSFGREGDDVAKGRATFRMLAVAGVALCVLPVGLPEQLGRVIEPLRQATDPLAVLQARAQTPDLLTYAARADHVSRQPIRLLGDALASWTEGSQRFFRLSGTVLIQQGTLEVRAREAVAWVDLSQYQHDRHYHLTIYAEGGIVFENGVRKAIGERALLELRTTADLDARAARGQPVSGLRPEGDGVLERSQAYRRRPHLPAMPPVTPTQAAAWNAQSSLPSRVAPGSSATPTADPAILQAVHATSANPPLSLTQMTSPVPLMPQPGPTSGPGAGSAVVQPRPTPITPPTPYGPATSTVNQLPQPINPNRPTPQPGPPDGPPPMLLQPEPLPAPPAVPGVPPGVPGAPPAAPAAPGQPGAGSNAAQRPIIRIQPRSSTKIEFVGQRRDNGELAVLITGGVSVAILDQAKVPLADIQADRVVLWTKGKLSDVFRDINTDDDSPHDKELYLAGNVAIRTRANQPAATPNRPAPKQTSQVLRADEVYFNATRNTAIAITGELEVRREGVPDPIIFRADELLQLSQTKFQAIRAEVLSSRLPSDPGLKVYMTEATYEERVIDNRNIFGIRYRNLDGTPAPEQRRQRIISGRNFWLEVLDVPVFYFPFVRLDADRPFGPLQSVAFTQDRIFGTQLYLTFNIFDLLGLVPPEGARWTVDLDYLSERGPALGTDLRYGQVVPWYLNRPVDPLTGQEAYSYFGGLRGFYIHDVGEDILGGNRGGPALGREPFGFMPNLNQLPHPRDRGRLFFNEYRELPFDLTLQTQLAYISDRNFIEQFYKNEWDFGPSQETFAYLKQQRQNWAWTLLAQPNLDRSWMTQTVWLPKAEGYLLGQSIFDWFTYNLRASAGYANLVTPNAPPPPILDTDQAIHTGRFDLWQEIALPFYLGPVKLAPYGVVDLTYYTDTLGPGGTPGGLALPGDARGRFYGGGGLRASLPFSRLYPDITSDLFDLNGIYHKVTLAGNYFAAYSDTPLSILPQLDRLNDDTTDQAIRDITPQQINLNSVNGLALSSSPIFNPQLYAIRRLVNWRTDTLDSIQVLQTDFRQRWQTKRGFPGQQHIVDWLTLDFSASIFPNSADNFGENVAFLEYDLQWNVGDRTSFVSSGWFDPFNIGARYFNFGVNLNRTDRTSFFIGYRQTDPLLSKAVTTAVTYVFSPKYAITGSATYDFGIQQSLSNSLMFTRIGTDLTVSIGVTYNALVNNFGFTFMVVPNAIAQTANAGGGLPFNRGLANR